MPFVYLCVFFEELINLHRLKMLHFLILITRKSCGILARAAGMHAFTLQWWHNLWVGRDVQTTRALRLRPTGKGGGGGYLNTGLYITLYVPWRQGTFFLLSHILHKVPDLYHALNECQLNWQMYSHLKLQLRKLPLLPPIVRCMLISLALHRATELLSHSISTAT